MPCTPPKRRQRKFPVPVAISNTRVVNLSSPQQLLGHALMCFCARFNCSGLQQLQTLRSWFPLWLQCWEIGSLEKQQKGCLGCAPFFHLYGGSSVGYGSVESHAQTGAGIFQEWCWDGNSKVRACCTQLESCQHRGCCFREITTIKHLDVYINLIIKGISINKISLNPWNKKQELLNKPQMKAKCIFYCRAFKLQAAKLIFKSLKKN